MSDQADATVSTETGSIKFHFQLQRDEFSLDVDGSFSGRGVTAIFGHSGCGKSTLLRCIAGLEKPQAAYLQVDQSIWEDSHQSTRLPTHQRPIGYVFQEASLFPHLSALKNLQYGQKRCGQSQNNDQLEQVIDLLGIENLLHRKPDRLSGGERQRVSIARALAVCPQLLLMDEPLSALDMKRKREILPFLERLHQELAIPVLYVTHSPAEVRRLADNLVVMDSGKIIASGKLTETEQYLDDSHLF